MTRDELINLAEQFGHWDGVTLTLNDVGLAELVRRVAAAEREACAQVIERAALQYAEPVWALAILEDIRARGETQ